MNTGSISTKAAGVGRMSNTAAQSHSLTWSRMARPWAGAPALSPGSCILLTATSLLEEPVQFKS